MNIVTETPSSPAVHSEIQQISVVASKFSDSSNTEHKVLKDTINRKVSIVATKGEKRKLPSPSKPRKFSSRLAAKRSRQNLSSFPV